MSSLYECSIFLICSLHWDFIRYIPLHPKVAPLDFIWWLWGLLEYSELIAMFKKHVREDLTWCTVDMFHCCSPSEALLGRESQWRLARPASRTVFLSSVCLLTGWCHQGGHWCSEQGTHIVGHSWVVVQWAQWRNRAERSDSLFLGLDWCGFTVRRGIVSVSLKI